MVGEISPDMMFWVGNEKVARMITDGYRLVGMGAVGLADTRGTRNSRKIFENAHIWSHLATHDHCAKISLTLGLPKKRTERVMGIILVG